MKNCSHSFLKVILVAGSVALAANARGQIISDSLIYATGTRSITAAPTPTGATSGWRIGDPNTSVTESASGTSFSQNGGAQVDLGVPDITAGNIYTLSITETAPAPLSASIYLGFYDETAANGPSQNGSEFYNMSGASMELGESGGGSLDTNAGQVGYSKSIPSPTINGDEGPNLLTLVLNTEGAQWTATASINGTQLASYTYLSNPTGLNSIYFANYSTGSDASTLKFTNISLAEAAAPEPSIFVYLASGLGLLTICLRRKRFQA